MVVGNSVTLATNQQAGIEGGEYFSAAGRKHEGMKKADIQSKDLAYGHRQAQSWPAEFALFILDMHHHVCYIQMHLGLMRRGAPVRSRASLVSSGV